MKTLSPLTGLILGPLVGPESWNGTSLRNTRVPVNAPWDCAERGGVLGCNHDAVQKNDCVAFLPEVPRIPTGATMNVSISYKHAESQQAVANELMRRLDKLGKLLKSYHPDLIQIKGVFSENNRTEEQLLALTLSLPTGTLRATGTGRNVL